MKVKLIPQEEWTALAELVMGLAQRVGELEQRLLKLETAGPRRRNPSAPPAGKEVPDGPTEQG